MSSAGCVDEDAGVLATGLAAHSQTWMRAIACSDAAFCQGLPYRMPPRKKGGLSTLVAVGDLGTSQPWKETGDTKGRCPPIPQQAGKGKLSGRVHVYGDVIGLAVSLTESGMICETGPWERLIGIVLVVIIEEGRPAY